MLGKLAIEKTESRIGATFAKYGRNVISIELFAEDVNGPRCGLDKECRLLVRLSKMKDVVVTAKDESFSKAISNAINRADRAVVRAIQRRLFRDADRKSKFAFAVFN